MSRCSCCASPIGLFFAMAGAGKFAGGVGNFVSHSSGVIPELDAAGAGQRLPLCRPLGGDHRWRLPDRRRFHALHRPDASLMLLSFTIAATGWHAKEGGPFHTNLILLSI